MRKQDKLSQSKDEQSGRTDTQGSGKAPASGGESHGAVPPHGDPFREQVRGSGTPHPETPSRRPDGRLPLPE